MKIIQDIVKPKHNDITHSPRENVIHPASHEEPWQDKDMPPYKHVGLPAHRGGSKTGIWIVALLSAIVLFFAISIFLSGATVKVSPKVHVAELDDDFAAKKEAGEADLPFEVMSLKGEETQILDGAAPKAVSRKATGTVVLFNKFSDMPQKLLINTRLESSAGKIYKTDTAVVIPGYHLKGTEIIPGSIEVGVTADIAGEEGNSEMTDLTIPGFKGTPKYAGFFGRSKTAIAGGVVGTVYEASPEEAEKAKDDVLARLHAKLLKQATAQIPKGYILYENASYFTSDGEFLDTLSKDQKVEISQKGTLYAFIFDREKLGQKIARDMVSQFDGSAITIPGLETLEFTMKNTDQPELANAGQIIFHLRGSARIIWKFNAKDLVRDLIGKKKADINTVLSKYKNIDQAEVVIRPFWKNSFPDDPAKFKIINMIEN